MVYGTKHLMQDPLILHQFSIFDQEHFSFTLTFAVMTIVYHVFSLIQLADIKFRRHRNFHLSISYFSKILER